MSRALPALFFAFLPALTPSTWPGSLWAQTQPPPDTKPARERHRIQEKEPPPPEGPWGPEEVGLTWHTPVWRGLVGTVGNYSGSSMSMNVPNGLEASSDGINPPVFERLHYHGEHFNSTSGGLTADLDMFRLSAVWFDGTFDAHATFSRDNGVAVQSRDLDVNGKAFGFRIGAYWPAFRYRDLLFDASVGPALTVGWLHQETMDIPGAILTRDTLDVLTGSLGPKASLRVMFGRFLVEVDAEYSYTTGGVHGWTKELSAGVGIHF
jgi:hypothetical protein